MASIFQVFFCGYYYFTVIRSRTPRANFSIPLRMDSPLAAMTAALIHDCIPDGFHV